ncbi:MAG TPA: YggT family protein [Mariprofundaceae bacterium]|nr:YggT family protein [Mariprofundaceae bacterium]
MFVLGYFLQAVAGMLDIVLTLAMVVVIARAILSWVSPDPYNPIVRIINQLSEPMLFPIRRHVPYFGGIDFSPIIVLLIIFFLNEFLVNSLYRIAAPMTH